MKIQKGVRDEWHLLKVAEPCSTPVSLSAARAAGGVEAPPSRTAPGAGVPFGLRSGRTGLSKCHSNLPPFSAVLGIGRNRGGKVQETLLSDQQSARRP